MPPTPAATCHHQHANGKLCGSPAMRGEQFCFFHHPTRRPPSRAAGSSGPVPFDLPPLADHEDVQIALSAIARHLANATLDTDRASLLLRCVETAAGYIRS